MSLKYYLKHYGYVILFFCLSLFLITQFLQFEASSIVKTQILIILAALYVVWGVGYHNFTKSLTMEVMIEYILIALLGIIILYGFI